MSKPPYSMLLIQLQNTTRELERCYNLYLDSTCGREIGPEDGEEQIWPYKNIIDESNNIIKEAEVVSSKEDN